MTVMSRGNVTTVEREQASVVGVTSVGHALYAAAIAGLGVASLVSGDFAYVWQPVPDWVPSRPLLAYLSGALMLAIAWGLVLPRAAKRAALASTLVFLAWLVLLHVPKIISNPLKEVTWSGAGEIAALVGGGCVLVASCAPRASGAPAWLSGARGVRIGQVAFAVGVPLVGVSHFIYAAATEEMVPTWLPARLVWAYLTGAGHIVAGLAILFRVLPRWAATLEAIMISAFVLLVHLPGVAGAPGDRVQWTMLCIASAIAGAAWMVARSYRGAR